MKWVIIIVVLVVVAGGGVFAWMYFSDGNLPDFASDDGAGVGVFVEMEPLTVPFVRDGKFAHYVVLTVSLEVKSQDYATRCREQIPRIRDAFVSALHGLAERRTADQTMINIGRIKASLVASAQKVMGSGVIQDVLVEVAH